MGKVRATDDEALATELWGDDKYWDDSRKQFVPGTEEPSPGNSSSTSETEPSKSGKTEKDSGPSVAPTTQTPSKTEKDSSTVPSTGGSGTAKK